MMTTLWDFTFINKRLTKRQRCEFRISLKWGSILNGNGYYARTKGKQPRTVFVRKRG